MLLYTQTHVSPMKIGNTFVMEAEGESCTVTIISNIQPMGKCPQLSHYCLLKLLVLHSRTQWGTTRRIWFHVSWVSFPPGQPEPLSFTALTLWRSTGLSFCRTSPECVCLLAAHDLTQAGHFGGNVTEAEATCPQRVYQEALRVHLLHPWGC